jgi:hypothetical protein
MVVEWNLFRSTKDQTAAKTTEPTKPKTTRSNRQSVCPSWLRQAVAVWCQSVMCRLAYVMQVCEALVRQPTSSSDLDLKLFAAIGAAGT